MGQNSAAEEKFRPYTEIVSECADAGVQMVRSLPYCRRYFFLHYRFEELLISDQEVVEGYIASDLRLSSAIPYPGYWKWVFENARNLPIYDPKLRGPR